MVNHKTLIVYLSVLLDPLIVTSYNPLVIPLKTVFNTNIELISLSLTFHMLPFAILCLFSGTLSDLYERPKIFMYGLFLSCLGSLLGALAPNILLFLISRTIQGIGSALVMPISLAIIGDLIPKQEMGKAMGMYGGFMAIGVTAGPLISGFLSLTNWRLVPFIIFSYALCIGFIAKIIFNIRGIGISRNEEGTFSFKQFRRVALNRNVELVSLAGFILFFCFQGVQSLISDSLSFPPLLLESDEIGVVFSLIGFVSILSSYIGGRLIGKIGEKKTIVFTYLTMTAPFLLLTFANSYLPYLSLLLLISGLNRFGWNVLQSLAVTFTPESRGTASSIFNFVRYLGFGLAPMLMAPIYKERGIKTIYSLNIIFLLLGFLSSLLIRMDVSKKGVSGEDAS